MTEPRQRRPDPFLDEVHRLKRDAFKRSGDDLERHIERLREIEKKYADRVVPPPKSDADTDAA